jgi:hypothetical protein
MTTTTLNSSSNGIHSLNGSGKTAIMNCSEGVTETVLKSAYKNIAEINVLIEKFLPGYLEKKKFFEEVQAEFIEQDKQLKSLQHDLDKEKLVVTTFKHFKGLPADNRVMLGVSAPATEGFRSAKKVQWLPYIREVIEKEGKFLSGAEIWEQLSKNEKLKADADQTQTKFKNFKSAVLVNLKIHALNPKVKNKFVGMYQDKFGLPEWLDNKGSLINPKFLKEFMYN